MNISKSLRTSILKNICERLLLNCKTLKVEDVSSKYEILVPVFNVFTVDTEEC